MDKINIEFASQNIELSEYKNYYELTNLVCYYDEPNLNGVKLNNDKTAKQKAETLCGMPIYAHYCVNTKGEPTFGGHEAYVDKNGNVAFNTEPIGVHEKVWIEKADVIVDGKTKNLPVLMAKQKIWKRNKNACAALLRLYGLGKLHNSWEITSMKYSFDNGVKTLEDYVFDGNTFLGFDMKNYGQSLSPNGSNPAYNKSAKVLSLSAIGDSELLVAEALAQDIIENKEKEGDYMENEKVVEQEIETSETPEFKPTETEMSKCGGKKKCAEDDVETPEKKKDDEKEDKDTDEEDSKKKKCAEKAELTVRDIRSGIWKAYYELHNRQIDCDVMQILPESHTAWLRVWGGKELDVTIVTYAVGEDDAVSIVEEKQGQLTVSVSEINSKIEEMTSALLAANEKITNLTTSVAELSEIKTKYDEVVAKETAAAHDAECEKLRTYMKNSKCFEESEMETDEVKAMIDKLDMATVKSMIADRLVEKMSKTEEVGEVKEKGEVQRELSSVDDSETDPVSFVRTLLSKR